jgi:hypothetical protein
MEHDPGARAREHAGDAYLLGAVRVLGGTQRAAGDSEYRRGQPAGIPIAIWKLGGPALDAGRDRLDVPARDSTTRPGDCGPSGSDASPISSARIAPCAKHGASERTNSTSSWSNVAAPDSRYSLTAPQTSPDGVRSAAIISLIAAHARGASTQSSCRSGRWWRRSILADRAKVVLETVPEGAAGAGVNLIWVAV